jgi:methylenetetrahydrofolate reductase (NADPH)
MKLINKWKTGEKATISFEVFPARTAKAEKKLDAVIDKLVGLGPDFISVTFGAGGSTRKGSYELVKKLKEKKDLEVLPYFACWGLGPEDITSVLDDYRNLGLDNLLAIRGDEPREQENFVPHKDHLPHASDLLRFVSPKYEFCLGVAGYPEGHIEAKNLDRDMAVLREKIELGAKFVLTNYFYDNRYFFDFLERCEKARIDVPIIPGIMPIYNVKMMQNLAKLCGATIPDPIVRGIDTLPADDKKALSEFGIQLATTQCAELLKSGVRGLHFYTMDRSKSVMEIVARLKGDGIYD